MTTRIPLLGVFLIAVLPWLHTGCGSGSAPGSGNSNVVIVATSLGDITIELDAAKAPVSVENFLAYVDEGFYDGTIFHRVIPDFMIQGGGITTEGQPKTTRPPIRNEADNGLENDRGTVAMARMAPKDSATAQFFINLTDNAFLNNGARDFGYAVFGRVTDGMDVVDAIAAVPTREANAPVEKVVIESVRRK